MNVVSSYFIQIFIIIFLRSYAYKFSYTSKSYFSKKHYYFNKFNLTVNRINSKKTECIDKLKNIHNFNVTKSKFSESFINPLENELKIKVNIFVEIKKWDNIYDKNHRSYILRKKINDIKNVFNKLNNTNKYLFFKDENTIYIYNKKKEYNLKTYLLNLAYSCTNVIKLYMDNIYLEIVNIIEKTLGNKIFNVDIIKELNMRKYVIIDMLHDIHRRKRINSKNVNLLFIGSNEFSNLCFKIILLIIKKLRNDIKLENVITKSPQKKGRNMLLQKSEIEEEANKNKINVFYYDKVKNDIYKLKNKTFDLCISVSFGEIFNNYFFRTINSNIFSLHPSLLPLYKGASPIQRSILNNESLFGYTIFLTNLNIDAGTILIKKAFCFDKNYNFNDIITILFTIGIIHLIKNIYFLSNYKLHLNETPSNTYNDFITQNNRSECSDFNKIIGNLSDTKRNSICSTNFKLSNFNKIFSNSYNKMPLKDNNYASKIKNDEKYVCFFCSTSLYIHNKVRSFINWPKAECSLFLFQNNTFKIIDVKLIKTSYYLNNNYNFINYCNIYNHKCFDKVPRKFVVFDKESLNIQCKNNTLLKIYKLQRKNKKIVNAVDFINSINKNDLLY
ncbi:methionyl-tRNA formyltransferase, putative [Plasmodium gallinaceum]|uniref:Methionyl-tRNA formyltransferase, putative n=1 Tax=Plasmodium gallinaceum TaxID=5849 RepID=A0A1J1GY82_PLAGA|nr:methionyl-tRNA formyltransferase, putative [Plasmodium gallinaceum]CRG97522.1 methionyl-tRNA formyltransferase, putative [Plasmodium gallinaceum]